MKKRIIYNICASYASSSANSSSKGFDISSMPSAGDIKLTCVPLHTTNPNRRVWSLSLNGSLGSEKNATVVERKRCYMQVISGDDERGGQRLTSNELDAVI